jgi:hypothetical protein
MAEDQHATDWPARPLPASLTKLLSDPRPQIEWVDDSLDDFFKPTLFNRVLWWFIVAMFGAAAFIFSATLTVRMLR